MLAHVIPSVMGMSVNVMDQVITIAINVFHQIIYVLTTINEGENIWVKVLQN